jgi:CxxH/CxxC protein (TIGR04129 family)
MNMEKIIYTCLEHIEIALDDFVNEVEVAPAMEKCDDKNCDYCSSIAIYKLSK